jgi:hypothetical protein
MARFTTTGGSGSGTPGPQGPQGPAGADGATPFTIVGSYDNGVSYNLGVAVYYNGGTYVRTGNPLNPGYPPAVGSVNESWTPLAEKGETPDLSSYSGDILPSADNQYVLGNSENRWKSISVGDGTIYITDATLGTEAGITVDDGVFLINGIAQAQLPNLAVTNLIFNDNTVQTTAAPAISEPTTYNPVFSATGLTYTGTPTTGSYMKIGKMVTFRIHVDFATVTNFGTGKYSLTLPFAPVAHYIFRDGGLHHTDTNPDDHYQVAGDADPGSTTLSLYYSSGAQDLAMDKNSPHTIHTNDYLYISGTYETA